MLTHYIALSVHRTAGICGLALSAYGALRAMGVVATEEWGIAAAFTGGAFILPVFHLYAAAAISGAFDEPYRYEHGEVIHKLPSWSFEGRTIWGMTHGIVSRFGRALQSP